MYISTKNKALLTSAERTIGILRAFGIPFGAYIYGHGFKGGRFYILLFISLILN